MSCAVHADVARLRHIRYQLDTNRPVSVEDIRWLVDELAEYEAWRRKEIDAANDAYLRAHGMGRYMWEDDSDA